MKHRLLVCICLLIGLSCNGSDDDTITGDDDDTVIGDDDDTTPGDDDDTTPGDDDDDDTTTPPVPDLVFTVDSSADVSPISRYIYGSNQADLGGATPNLTLVRSGGNRWTAYNWETNASNAGSDWFFNNDGYLGGGDIPGEALRPDIQDAHDHDASYLLTLPIQGYVAADKDGTNVFDTPNHLQTRFETSVALKGAPFSLPPNLNDGMVYQDEFVHWVNTNFPNAPNNPLRTIFYSMDNEPALWAYTHEEVHPAPATYVELVGQNLEYAAAVKSVVPTAEVFGFVGYGWAAYADLQGAPDAGAYGDFIDYFLDSAQDAENAGGDRLIDVLDLHWYPEAQGGGVRIIDDDNAADVVEARVQAPRSLWDPTYTEDSWISQWGTMGPVELVPLMQQKIAAHYPGTKLSFSEYNYGGYGHISGALAQADVLGIFGREGVFAATLWEMGGDHSYHYGAFAMYRDYDGQGGSFGDTSVSAQTTDVAASSIHASVFSDNPDSLVLVAINKTGDEQIAQIDVTHTTQFSNAKRYQLTSAGPTPTAETDLTVSGNQVFATLPAQSVTTLVFEP